MGKGARQKKEKTVSSSRSLERDLSSPEYFILHCITERDVYSDAKILVPACGLNPLSEYLYDKGFSNIHNIDGSLQVISQKLNELKESARLNKGMLWRRVHITEIGEKYKDVEFDIILDRDGLSSLTSNLTNIVLYLDDIKKILATSGRYLWILTTLEVPVLLDLVLSHFRIGWRTIAFIPPNLDYYVISFEKLSSFTCEGVQFEKPLNGKDTIFAEKIRSENIIRRTHSKR